MDGTNELAVVLGKWDHPGFGGGEESRVRRRCRGVDCPNGGGRVRSSTTNAASRSREGGSVMRGPSWQSLHSLCFIRDSLSFVPAWLTIGSGTHFGGTSNADSATFLPAQVRC